ncbi:hypothetical protein GOODEAATRI_016654 [Goodea atripinnis]|uniref:Uncharacterized protein n=1 Tax=Goodea atripinnis TaxID=208336 RepID=A0ABV0PEN8_9TELE
MWTVRTSRQQQSVARRPHQGQRTPSVGECGQHICHVGTTSAGVSSACCQILCKTGHRAFRAESAAPQVERGSVLTGTRCPDQSRAAADNKPRERRIE